jgi:hypothetical protein
VSATVNWHNYHIWGCENHHNDNEHGCDSPKFDMWCALMKYKVIGPFLLEEPTVTGDTFLVMMGNVTLRYVPAGKVSQLHGTLLHLSRRVRAFLNRKLPHRSPDVTPLDVFFCEFVKDIAYCAKVQNMNELRDRIVRAADYVTTESNAWRETECHHDVCRATNGAHRERERERGRSTEHMRNFVKSSV